MRPILLASSLAAVIACGDNHGKLQDGSVEEPDASCVPASQRPQLESFMTGDLVVGNAQQENSFALTVPMDRTILLTSLRENEASPQFGGMQCILRDADAVAGTPAGIRCRRNSAGTDTPSSTGEVTVRWTVVTFTSGVTVQRGIANTGFTNPNVVTLATAADPAKSFVLLSGPVVGGGGWGNNEFQRARLLDANTLEVRTGIAGSETAWQVVTMDGAAVQRGTTTIGTADTTAMEPVTSPGNLVLASYTTDNASSIAAASLMLQAATNTNAIQFNRSMGGAALDVSWEAIKLPFFTRTFTTSFAAGETSKMQTIANLPVASSVAIASNQSVLGQSCGMTAYNGTDLDLLGEGAASITIAAGNVTLERAVASATASINWTVVDFAHDRCDDF